MNFRVVIVDDEMMMADMLKVWFSRRPDIQVVGCAADGVAALALCRKEHPDVATVDIQLPGMDGLELAAQLLQAVPKMKIIIVSCQLSPYCLIRAEKLGVHGYVDKMSSLCVLEQAVRAVVAGKRFFSETVRHELDQQQQQPDAFYKILTEREQDILGMLSLGMSDEEMGAHLKISPHTVWTHRRNIRRKLDINDDRKLMQYAREMGLEFSLNNLRIAAERGQAHRKKSS
jgi:DNA-binding NarL/FixJ family response regulator